MGRWIVRSETLHSAAASAVPPLPLFTRKETKPADKQTSLS